MKKLRYKLNNEGHIDACGYLDILPFEVDKNTPFQTIQESKNWRKVNGVWEWFDSSWTYPDFVVRVTIPETVILDDDFYTALIGQVKQLISIGNAAQETVGENRVMYFNGLLPEHRAYMEADINVKIEEK